MNQILTTSIPEKKAEEQFVTRPQNLKEDFEELITFFDFIFDKELTAKGMSTRALFEEFKAIMPFMRIIGLFSKNYKHVNDGFVIESQSGKIIASVNVGYAGNYWEISMVATHPEYRRRGLARKLVTLGVDHAKTHRATMCVLEVIDENKPAYELYKSMGFEHFDSYAKLKFEPELLSGIHEADLPVGYEIQKMKDKKKINGERFELSKRATPESVQSFLPIDKKKYHKPFAIRLLRPIFKIVVRPKFGRWLVRRDGELVATLIVHIGRSEKSPHRLDLEIDPDHVEQLTEPLLAYGLSYIKDKGSLNHNVISEVRNIDEIKLKMFKQIGFTEFERDHLLGLKLD
jgi:ribosomal protein S18 acetylase RimI-like enzyme